MKLIKGAFSNIGSLKNHTTHKDQTILKLHTLYYTTVTLVAAGPF